jgi:hypothetical protein|tara:strand:- start:106 stop:840 length:735 start_codon:yes stop_codon:yes gene_type:complete
MGSPFNIKVSKLYGLSPLKQEEDISTEALDDIGGSVGEQIADFITPESPGEAILSILPVGGKGISKWITKSKAGKKLLSKFPGLGKLFTKTKIQKNQPFSFGGGKVPKSLTAPKETKLLTGPEVQTRYGKENLKSLFKPVDTKNFTTLPGGAKVPKNMTWFGPKGHRGYAIPGTTKYEAYLTPKKIYTTDKPEIWTVERINRLKKEGYDVIQVKEAGKIIESIPLDKDIIKLTAIDDFPVTYGN